jgi:hypothetical protein
MYVGFTDNGQGGSSVVGQFVSSQGPRGLSTTAKGGYARTESRGLLHSFRSFHSISLMTTKSVISSGNDATELTMANGRRRIQQVANALSLASRHVDAASRIFNLALQHNFLQVYNLTVKISVHSSNVMQFICLHVMHHMCNRVVKQRMWYQHACISYVDVNLHHICYLTSAKRYK